MVNVIPYISVKNALKALELYKKIFGVEVIGRTSPSEEQISMFNISEDADLTKITIHSEFKIGDSLLFMSDAFNEEESSRPNVAILVSPDSLDQAKKFYTEAEKYCEITAKFEKQFWGDYFGSFTDPFGIRWQLAFSSPQ